MDNPLTETLRRCADCGELGWHKWHPQAGYVCEECRKRWEDEEEDDD